MIESKDRYYLKFFEEPKSLKEFRLATKPTGMIWARGLIRDLRDEGYIAYKKGKYSLTSTGRHAWENYLNGTV